MLRWLVIVSLLTLVGCGMNPPPLAGPVGVKGKVVSSDGKPIGNVVVNLQPLENGYMKAVDVQADGTFSVEAQAGKYAYFFTPKTGSKTVPPQLAALTVGDLDRTVAVAEGKELLIEVR